MRKFGEAIDQAWLSKFQGRLVTHRRDVTPEPVSQCTNCDDARFVRATAELGHPLFGERVPCPACSTGFTLEERIARAGIPLDYASVTLESCRERAWPAAYAAVEAWDGASNLVLAGMPGRGKSFLAVAALRREVVERERMGRFAYVEQLLEEVRRRYGDGESEDAQTYLDRLVGWPLLVLDDIAAERATPWVTEKLVSLLERRRQAGNVTVVTTNRMSIAEIARHYSDDKRYQPSIEGERLASRLGPGVFTWVPVLGSDMRQYAQAAAR